MTMTEIKCKCAVSTAWTVTFYILLICNGYAVAAPTNPNINQDMFYANSNNGYHRTGVSTYDGPNGNHDLLYAYAGANRQDGVRYGAGLLDQTASVLNGNLGVSHRIGVVGAEIDGGTNGRLGSMARVTAIDGTLHTGPVDINYGVGIDTGAAVDWNRMEVEAKLLGVGAKAGAHGFEFCVIGCFGVNW